MATKKKNVKDNSARTNKLSKKKNEKISVKINSPKSSSQKLRDQKHRMRVYNKYHSSNSDKNNLSVLYSQVLPILESYQFTQVEKAALLDVDPSTISRWKTNDGYLRPLSTKNVYDLEELRLKGIAVFGDEGNFLQWLNSENFALGNKPKQMILDPFGLEYVDEALDALAWGAVV